MGSLLFARGRALTACVSAIAAAALAGCTTTGATSSSIAGGTLTIYVSKPSGQLTSAQQDVVLAEKLALHQIGTTIGKFTINETQVAGGKLSDHARSAIADPTAIAYIGELVPGTSGQTIGITNAQGVLQVSPTDTALELTQAVPQVPDAPGKYYESVGTYGQTFARVVPNTKFEAEALVAEMHAAGVKHLYVKVEKSDYGRVLNGLIVPDAGSAGITIASSPSGADGVLYAGSSPAEAAQLFNQTVSTAPSVKLFAPSALASDSFAATLSPSAQRDAYISSPGFTTGDLPSQGQQFVAAFKSAYGHAPATQAIFGYQAVASVLAAMQKAGNSANSRSTVVHDFFAIKDRDAVWPSSAVGSYTIDKSGDITYASGAPFVFSRIKDGVLVPFKAVQQSG